jgi:hypothetical protein
MNDSPISIVDTIPDSVLPNLPYDRSDPAVGAALANKHPAEILCIYLNWRNRLISAQPRSVARSIAFNQNPVAAERTEAISHVVADIEQGNDLTKYLSRRVTMGFALPSKPGVTKNLARLQHLDLLLNEWGIHHLHISTTIEPDGFVERDDPLLFAMFEPETAYFLDIGTHSSFVDQRLAEIAVENWPNAQLFLEIKDIRLRNGVSYSRDDRKQMRSGGLFSFITIGDKVFSPRGGISTAGTSTQASVQANYIIRTLRAFEERVKADPTEVAGLIRSHGYEPGDPPRFRFALLPDGGFGVIEMASGVAIGPWGRPA